MTIITEYQCDICKGRYSSSEEAIQCEQKGEFDPAQFPIGFMFPGKKSLLNYHSLNKKEKTGPFVDG